jgi:hypothetical protein
MSQPIAWTDSPSTSSPLSATNLNRATKRALFNVKDQPYNAAGNGVADDTTAIQNAINAANTAGGGRVYLPAGVYLLSSALTMKRRVVLLGDGTTASDANTGTILYQSSTSANAIAAVDQRDMGIENLSIVGPGSGTGTGIRFTRSVNADIARLVFRGIQVTGFGSQGIELSNPITSVFDSVLVDSTTVGWNVHGVTGAGGSAGTSCTFLGCYTSGCTQTGYRLDNMCYCAFVGCASDACGIGYELIESGTQGISFTGCGCESTVSGGASYPGIGWKINAAVGVALSGCFTYDLLNTSVWVTGSAAAVNITGFSENTPQGGVPSSIKVDSGSTASLDSIAVVTAMSLAAGTTPLSLPAIASATSATTGAATALPANPVGYITASINGTSRKIPYYAT